MKNIYGFPEPAEPVKKRDNDELPIKMFKFSELFEQLKTKKIHYTEAFQRFPDEISWGSSTGAIKVNLMPNRLLIFSRATTDLDGERLWVCKKAYQLNTEEYKGYERSAADEIYEVVEELANQQIDQPVRNYNNLEYLVKYVATHTMNKTTPIFHYDSIKKVHENSYIIAYLVSNSGVGQISPGTGRGAAQSPYVHLHLVLEDNGIIRSTIHYIEIEYEGSDWIIGSPFFDQKFLPTQSKSEICEAIVTAFKHLA